MRFLTAIEHVGLDVKEREVLNALVDSGYKLSSRAIADKIGMHPITLRSYKRFLCNVYVNAQRNKWQLNVASLEELRRVRAIDMETSLRNGSQ